MPEVYEIPATAPTATIKVDRVVDYEALDTIARHPDIYPYISDDASPAADDFTTSDLLLNPANLFLGLHINDVLKGFWMFLSRSYDILEVHTCLLPEARGDIATKGAPAALRHVFTSTPTMTLVTHVPTPNHAAHKFASWVGFKTLHTIKDAWRKDGKTSDVEVMCFSVFDWFRCLTGDAPSRARYLISALAMNGQFPKAAYLHTYFTTLLGDLGRT